MIKVENEILQVKGHGREVSAEVGCIMNYFIENCTEKELNVMLETMFDDMAIPNVVKFYKGLQKVTNVDWTIHI